MNLTLYLKILSIIYLSIYAVLFLAVTISLVNFCHIIRKRIDVYLINMALYQGWAIGDYGVVSKLYIKSIHFATPSTYVSLVIVSLLSSIIVALSTNELILISALLMSMIFLLLSVLELIELSQNPVSNILRASFAFDFNYQSFEISISGEKSTIATLLTKQKQQLLSLPFYTLFKSLSHDQNAINTGIDNSIYQMEETLPQHMLGLFSLMIERVLLFLYISIIFLAIIIYCINIFGISAHVEPEMTSNYPSMILAVELLLSRNLPESFLSLWYINIIIYSNYILYLGLFSYFILFLKNNNETYIEIVFSAHKLYIQRYRKFALELKYDFHTKPKVQVLKDLQARFKETDYKYIILCAINQSAKVEENSLLKKESVNHKKGFLRKIADLLKNKLKLD